MNKTLIIAGYFALVIIVIIVVALIAIFAPTALDKFITFGGVLLTTALTGAVTLFMLGKQTEAIAEVKHQTNGTLSALREENASLTTQLLSVVGNTPTVAKYRPVTDPARHAIE